ncbi:MAG: CpaF family protein [Deltaproteobacteria bacterium]|nr:CpaF family protein [Deltaproteobacteria bacterium]
MIPAEVYSQTIFDFLSPVRSFLDDPNVSEIMINGPDEVYVEQNGRLVLTECRFDAQQLLSAILNVAQFQGVTVDQHHPILEARLPDGSRVEAILPPAASKGPHVAIRRFSEDKLTVGKLIALGSLTREAAETLQILVECKQNIVVAGGTGSGKTSMLNALSSFIPNDERVVVIEDAKELQLQGRHVVQLEVQKPDSRGRGRVTTADLFKATLRMRPDRIVVGEIRGSEALELIQAMTSGHGGCMSTVHATYPTDTLNRLETMALMSEVELPLFALRSQIVSAIDIIVQTCRLRDGKRYVTHITEVDKEHCDNGYKLKDVFIRRYTGTADDGSISSELLPSGILPRCAEAVHSLGMRFPRCLYSYHG